MRSQLRTKPFVDVGDLRRALAFYAVDRPVKIRLPDGREFPILDVQLEDYPQKPFDEAKFRRATLLFIAQSEEEGKPKRRRKRDEV